MVRLNRSAIGLLLLFLVLGCGKPALRMANNAQDQFALAKREFDKKHWLKAVEGFQRVIFNFPGATIVDTAQYYLATSYFENKDYELAAVEYQRLMSKYPMSSFLDGAQYMTGVCYLENTPGHYALDQEDMKRAIQTLQDFILDNPDSPLVEDAKKAILDGQSKLARKEYENGMLYFKVYDVKAAEIYFQYVVDNYTNTKYAALSLFKLSELEYKKGKYPEALEKFNNFIKVYPGSDLVPKANEYIDKITRQLETVSASDESDES
ncbi:MAG: outer membrane protein assembly factor BamD [Candidatus Zixiibacteriota bacterium]|nr:MAG: outer membrane protein assembly factor BamD [candidate division Zixibacteria bacterium]